MYPNENNTPFTGNRRYPSDRAWRLRRDEHPPTKWSRCCRTAPGHADALWLRTWHCWF